MSERLYGGVTMDDWKRLCQYMKMINHKDVPVSVDQLEAFIVHIHELEKALDEIIEIDENAKDENDSELSIYFSELLGDTGIIASKALRGDDA